MQKPCGMQSVTFWTEGRGYKAYKCAIRRHPVTYSLLLDKNLLLFCDVLLRLESLSWSQLSPDDRIL